MCGIVGYVGKNKKAIPTLIEGLKTLEYRGYDSAGIAYLDGNNIDIVKSKGKISNLEEKLNMNFESNLGIGHTRWATHGVPSEVNAHPHEVENVVLVHNGIIENYQELRNKIGYDYKSETDSEVLCSLINSIYKKTNDKLKTLMEFQKEVRGSYALGIIFKDDKEHLYAVRKDSPLIVAINDNEYYIASDVPAILDKTNKYVLLEQGNIAVITSESLDLYDKDLNKIDYEVKTFEGSKEAASKGGFDHFMIKEIYDTPEIIKTLTRHYLNDGAKSLLEKMPDISKYERIDIVGCGSAYHVGLIGKYLIEEYNDILVNVDVASEYRYSKQLLNDKCLVIVISQSGETADTLAALRLAKESGAHTIGVINVVGSSIAREADEVLYIKAGYEISVATTKAFSAQAYVLALLALASKVRKDSDLSIMSEIEKLPEMIQKIIDRREEYLEIAKKIYKHDNVFFIGRRVDHALGMEGSLKLKEISYINSECYAAGELKHGTLSLISNETPVISIVTDKTISEKTISNIKETKARGSQVVLVTTNSLYEENDYCDDVVTVDEVDTLLQPILAIIPLQLIAYEVAKLRGENIDKPRNLAKSVTVE